MTILPVYWEKPVMVYTGFRKWEPGKVTIHEEIHGSPRKRYSLYHWRRYYGEGFGVLQDGHVEITLMKAMRQGQGEGGAIKGEKWKKIEGKGDL